MSTSPTGIFALDYTNNTWTLNTPPDKRQPKWLAFASALMKGKQWKNDAFFGSYMLGSNDAAYDFHASYVVGDRIIYYIQAGGNYFGDNAVYECIHNNPVHPLVNYPPIGTNVIPDVAPDWVVDSVTALKWLSTGNNGNPFYWVKVQDNFIGVIERANWSCQQLTMEVALNRWFNVANYANYQWDHTGPAPFTQIYIDTDTVITRQEGAFSAPNGYGEYSLYTFSTYGCFSLPPAASQYNFTIMVPVAIFNALVQGSAFGSGHTEDASNVTTNGGMIRSLVDKFNAVGMIYNITTY